MSDIREDAKNIKKDYIKSKFVDATKTIISEEGVLNVTVRKVAELTGYSYATIYHYFNDLNDLLLETKIQMIHELTPTDQRYTEMIADPLNHLKSLMRWPLDFFLTNPNIFKFFYTFEIDSRNEDVMKSLNLENAYYNDFMPFVENGCIKQSDIPVISRTILYTVFGMITLYLSGNGLSKDEIYKDVENVIDLLLGCNRSN